MWTSLSCHPRRPSVCWGNEFSETQEFIRGYGPLIKDHQMARGAFHFQVISVACNQTLSQSVVDVDLTLRRVTKNTFASGNKSFALIRRIAMVVRHNVCMQMASVSDQWKYLVFGYQKINNYCKKPAWAISMYTLARLESMLTTSIILISFQQPFTTSAFLNDLSFLF